MIVKHTVIYRNLLSEKMSKIMTRIMSFFCVFTYLQIHMIRFLVCNVSGGMYFILTSKP